MKYNVLGKTNMKVSMMGLGGAAFSNIYGTFDEQQSLRVIDAALRGGVNYLDTSPWYGQGCSEITIGKALQNVPRDRYFVAGKVGRYDRQTHRMFDFSADRTLRAVDNSLQLLGIGYFDVIQVHDLSFAPDIDMIMHETLPALAQVVRNGKARYIGLADYDINLMKQVVQESEVDISTILSHSRCTMFDMSLQHEMEFFKSKRIGVINAACTGMGLLTSKGPRSWHPADPILKSKCVEAAAYCREHEVELARVATWYSMHQSDADTHVCGFQTEDEVNAALDVVEKGLTDRELYIMEQVKLRFFNGSDVNWNGVEVMRHRASLLEIELGAAASSLS